MLSFIRKRYILALIICAVVLYGASLAAVFFDSQFTYRWIGFSLHIAAISLIAVLFLLKTAGGKTNSAIFSAKELIPLGSITAVAGAVSLAFLTDYPWIGLGDEVRDGGLQAMQIANGTLTNIFAYGRYDAHGLIIPTFTSFFYYLFGNNVLTYRFPSALIGIADIILLYVMVRLLYNKTAAFFSALILTALPLHLFFARTQIVVIFSSFWTSASLLALFVLLKKQRALDYVFFGTLLGFVFGFHSAVRVVAILLLLTIMFFNLGETIFRHQEIRTLLRNIFLLAFFCFVGFGPRLLFTNTTNFLHTSRFVFEKNVETQTPPAQTAIQAIGAKYIQSLLVWITEPTSSFVYQDTHPVLPLFIALFFLFGIGYTLIVIKKPFFYVLTFLVISIPFFSSAITDMINADHRIITLLPIGAIFAGIGITVVLRFLHFSYLRYATMAVVVVYLGMQIFGFFAFRPADKNYFLKDYVSMHVISLLQSQQLNEKNSTNMCLFVSPKNGVVFNYPHYHEQYQYFFPNITTTVTSDPQISDNEAYVFYGDCPYDYTLATSKNVISCNTTSFNFYCPLNYTGDIIVHY